MKQGGVSRYSVQKCLSQSTEIFVGEHFSFLQIFVVSKNFMDRRLGKKNGGVSRYSVKIFMSHSTGNFVGEPFYFIQSFWYRNTLWIRGGE